MIKCSECFHWKALEKYNNCYGKCEHGMVDQNISDKLPLDNMQMIQQQVLIGTTDFITGKDFGCRCGITTKEVLDNFNNGKHHFNNLTKEFWNEVERRKKND